MKGNIRISDAEWLVMKIVWKKSPISASEVIKVLKPETNWNPKTIHTLITRLVNKNVLGVDKLSPQYMYYPIVSEESCQIEETTSFMKRVYDGSLYLLLTNFLKTEKLSQEEINELQELLDKNKE